MVIKKGPRGAEYVEKHISLSMTAPKVKVVDTTAAGDVLAGTFLTLLAKNIPIKKALEISVNVASYSITDFGIEHLLDDKYKLREFLNSI